MNQILSVDNTKKSKGYRNSSGPLEINTILKIFAIAILIFGVFMVGSGSYSMYKDSQKSLANAKPTIHIEDRSETQALIKIKHSKELASVTYNWNNKEAIEVQCQGKKSVEQIIEIPTGTNTLNIFVKDINGQESRHQQTYTIKGNISIEFTVEGNNIKITAEGKDELSYLTYRWDEDEETRVEINNTTAEEKIEIPKGLHTLTVIVVDINNTTETKEQEVNGVTRPKLDVSTDGGDNFIIRATDEQGLKKVEFIINEDEKYMLNLDGRKELEYAYPLHDGENRLEVIIYNVNDISETARVLVNK